MEILTATLELRLDTLVGIGIPTLCHPLPLCPFLLEGGTALSSTAENLPCSTCRRKLCPDCVMCAVYCSRNRPSACRSSPERRKELRGRRRHQVGGPPSAQGPSASGSCPVFGVGSLSPGPGGLSGVGSVLCTPSAVGWGTWCSRTQKAAPSCLLSLGTASVFSPSASSHLVYQGESFVHLLFVYKSLSVCLCMVCVGYVYVCGCVCRAYCEVRGQRLLASHFV